MEIKQLKVSSIDPFLTAEKWNNSIEYSENFEGIISAILGKKFKGIYKPHLTYNINDYVWHDGKAYIVTGEKPQTFSTIQKENVSSPFFFGAEYLCLVNGKLSTVSSGSSKTINHTIVDYISYKEGKEFAIGVKGNTVYKLFVNGKTEQYNFSVSNNIKKILVDDFNMYCLTDDYTLMRAELDDTSQTYFENLKININHEIVDLIVSESYFYVFTTNNEINVISKRNGNRLNIVTLDQYVSKPNKCKLVSSDKYSLSFFDGNDKIYTFFLDSTSITYSGVIVSESLSIGVDSISYSNGRIAMCNDSIISSYIASRYTIEEVDLKMLINTSSIIKLYDADMSIDFSNGHLTSVSKDVIPPKDFKWSEVYFENGKYDDGTNVVKFIKNKGITLEDGLNIKYSNDNLINKVIVLDVLDYKTTNAINSIGYAAFGNNNKIKLIPARENIDGHFKSFIHVTGNPSSASYKVSVFKNGYLVDEFTGHQESHLSENVISFYPDEGVSGIIEKFSVLDNQDRYIVDILSYCSYDIDSESYENPTPFSVVKSNENGSFYIKSENGSVINSKSGISVNSSSDYNLNKSNVTLNTIGSKLLNDEIVKLRNKLSDYSQTNHVHDFSNLLNIPNASTSESGIVRLSNDENDTSSSVAASSFALNKVFKLANHDHPYSLTTHNHDFSKLLNIPHASTSQKGVVQLSSNYHSDSSQTTASTPFALMQVYNLANHSHPYLSINGGSINNNLRINGGTLEIAKNGMNSFIKFSPQSNDSGYILHHENNNSSILRFVVSDDVSDLDLFQWGAEVGGAYNNAMQLNTKGELWLNSFGNFGSIVSRGTGNFEGSITASSVISKNNISAANNVEGANIYSKNGINAEGTCSARDLSIRWNANIAGTIEANYISSKTSIYSVGNSSFGSLESRGDGYFAGNINANDMFIRSDRRIKKNIVKIDDAISKVEKISGYTYNLKRDESESAGLIAQELKEVLPNAVKTDSEGKMTIQYHGVIALLLESIKELNERIKTLENKEV